MTPLIELQDVTVIRDGKTILDRVNWTMQPDEHWAVIGKNGAGKSFLLQLLSANFHPTSGIVKVMGEELGKASVWDLRKQIGFISDQLHQRYHNYLTVREVVCSGFFASIGIYEPVEDYMAVQADEILSRLLISHLAERCFGELSHGEQRRVLIARALVFHPRMLVFDEPCSGLDIPSREEFLASVSMLTGHGHNLVFVTHHLEEVISAITNVLFIKDGKIIAQGNKPAMFTESMLLKVFDFPIPLIQSDGRYWPKLY